MMEIISNLLLWNTLQHWSPFSKIITVVSFRITLSDLLSYLTIFLTFSLHFLGRYLYVPISTQLGFHSKLLRLSRPEFCEMKYFLPYQSARNVTAISHFGAPHVNEGSQREHNACDPADAITRHGDCWGAWVGWGGIQEAAIGHSCHLLWWTRN